MRFLSLFSGIGALDYGLEQAGWQPAGQCEIEPFCCAVLEKHWPGLPRWNDVRTLSGVAVRDACGRIDAIVGGPPCQPASVAGKRQGEKDARWLWGEFIRLVRELGPDWFIAENPRGFLALPEAAGVFRDLENAGYEVWPVDMGAEDVGAPHQRRRIWIVGRKVDNAAGTGCQTYQQFASEQGQGFAGSGSLSAELANATGTVTAGLPSRAGEELARSGIAGTGVPGMELGNAAGESTCTQPRQQSEEPATVATGTGEVACAAGVGQADTGCTGLREHDVAGESGISGHVARRDHAADGWLWPARPGQRRFSWEHPRLIRFNVECAVGAATDGTAVRLVRVASKRDRAIARWANAQALKAAGNGVVWQCPYLIALAINEVINQQSKHCSPLHG